MPPVCLRILRLMSLAGLGLLAHAAAGSARDSWLLLEVDNVRICSNMREKDLKKLHREIHYFNRTMEAMFNRKLLQMEDPLYVLLVRSEKELETYVGERAGDMAGVFIGQPGMEMVLVRGDVARHMELNRVLFHEMTHKYLASFNLPLWQNEGFAELYETVEVNSRDVSVGLGNDNWVAWHNSAPKFNKQDYPSFFSTTASSDYYRDGRTSINFYGRAWLFAHYCWQGQKELRDKYLELGRLAYFDEATFSSIFGFGYEELDNRLKSYAKWGRYTYTTFQIEKLQEPPPVRLRPASAAEVAAYEARALLLAGKPDQAEARLEGIKADDPLITETRWILAIQDPESHEALLLAHTALKSGSANPLISSYFAYRKFRHLMQGRSGQEPGLTVDEARELMQWLQPSFRAPRRFPNAVATAILVLDAAGATAPPNLLSIFDNWQYTHKGPNREALAALARIEQRSAAPLPQGL